MATVKEITKNGKGEGEQSQQQLEENGKTIFRIKYTVPKKHKNLRQLNFIQKMSTSEL